MSTETPIIVFDGVCVLCNGWVRFLLRHDREARFRFAAMQTDAGHALLVAHGLDPVDPVSFLLVDTDRAWTDTDAIARVLATLGAPWSIAALLMRMTPRVLRDPAYRFLARHRYRVFGRHTACALPPPDAVARFIR
ncbi:thiol-disulfide oxidoreductase DCC family protein [Lysobacter sp. TY2-98]|uniref:thiol-disulfide oxidoreductase DCC family protein n=1 Tax=Lysobacter sp. TY2-98 TaxID=2290922 RepID=UPI000E207D25|nr:thiol-disulfide oxidoreductase DCC family protein [Lysobacter sp. TY2-98]AXK71002.1 thiol-disulfide oxidoreductase DCC family protein [Lysobacter sp. TY2-98]